LRKQNREKADELLRAGRENEARDYMRRSVDINHVMALELIKAARKMKVKGTYIFTIIYTAHKVEKYLLTLPSRKSIKTAKLLRWGIDSLTLLLLVCRLLTI
jgi:hypothetical protein